MYNILYLTLFSLSFKRRSLIWPLNITNFLVLYKIILIYNICKEKTTISTIEIVKYNVIKVKGKCTTDHISAAGPKKRGNTPRKAPLLHPKPGPLEKINLKFIDTSAKFGHGRFQAPADKLAFQNRPPNSLSSVWLYNMAS
uniref:60S ribosomal protein L3 n=1 Tax=Cacopsylla melanoneura TaxID=428564 RepID=A0A8D8W2V5_9HEMI